MLPAVVLAAVSAARDSKTGRSIEARVKRELTSAGLAAGKHLIKSIKFW